MQGTQFTCTQLTLTRTGAISPNLSVPAQCWEAAEHLTVGTSVSSKNSWFASTQPVDQAADQCHCQSSPETPAATDCRCFARFPLTTKRTRSRNSNRVSDSRASRRLRRLQVLLSLSPYNETTLPAGALSAAYSWTSGRSATRWCPCRSSALRPSSARCFACSTSQQASSGGLSFEGSAMM